MKLGMLGLLTILALAAGCNRAKPVVVQSPAPAAATDNATPGAGTDAAADTKVPAGGNGLSVADTADDRPTIKIANWEETQKLVAQHSGKVVILDLWASW